MSFIYFRYVRIWLGIEHSFWLCLKKELRIRQSDLDFERLNGNTIAGDGAATTLIGERRHEFPGGLEAAEERRNEDSPDRKPDTLPEPPTRFERPFSTCLCQRRVPRPRRRHHPRRLEVVQTLPVPHYEDVLVRNEAPLLSSWTHFHRTYTTDRERVWVSEFIRKNENWAFLIECVSYFLSFSTIIKEIGHNHYSGLVSNFHSESVANLQFGFVIIFPRKSTRRLIRVRYRNHCC